MVMRSRAEALHHVAHARGFRDRAELCFEIPLDLRRLGVESEDRRLRLRAERNNEQGSGEQRIRGTRHDDNRGLGFAGVGGFLNISVVRSSASPLSAVHRSR